MLETTPAAKTLGVWVARLWWRKRGKHREVLGAACTAFARHGLLQARRLSIHPNDHSNVVDEMRVDWYSVFRLNVNLQRSVTT